MDIELAACDNDLDPHYGGWWVSLIMLFIFCLLFTYLYITYL
jgi:hypothetical protein